MRGAPLLNRRRYLVMSDETDAVLFDNASATELEAMSRLCRHLRSDFLQELRTHRSPQTLGRLYAQSVVDGLIADFLARAREGAGIRNLLVTGS